MTFSLKSSTAIVLSLGMLSTPVFADMDAAKAFLDSEIGDLSVLPRGARS
jgi:glycerol transport system substrate-binding protein